MTRELQETFAVRLLQAMLVVLPMAVFGLGNTFRLFTSQPVRIAVLVACFAYLGLLLWFWNSRVTPALLRLWSGLMQRLRRTRPGQPPTEQNAQSVA